MEYPGVRLGQRGGLFDLYQYYLGGGDQSDDGPVTTDPFPGAGGGGGDATNTMGVELSRIKQPTGSPFRTDVPQMDFFASLPKDDPRYMSAADQIFLQNRADAGEFFYGSPYYIGGAPGNIVQSGPGRQFTGDEAMFVGDPRNLGEDEDERFSFASLREGIMDNPLFKFGAAIANPVGALIQGGIGIAQSLFPTTNERAILERRAGDQGIAVDDIGRIAMQDFGFRPDPTTGEMKYTALSYTDPSGVNIFQGYNLNKITQETIDNRKNKLKDRLDKGIIKQSTYDTYITAIDAFEKNIFNKIKKDTEDEVKRREYIAREKKREKIQEDLTAAGFGEAGAVGLDPDMDKQIIDDYTYTPPSGDDKPQAPPPKPDNVPRGIREDTPGGGEFSAPAPSAPRGGGANYSNVSTGGGPPGTRSSSPSTRSNNPWGRYANGGIVDLL
jgi:hypothetical protein